ESARLVSPFFRQPGVDVFLTTTACAPDAALHRMFKSGAPRDASFSEGFLWVAEDRSALEDLFKRVGVSRPAAHAIATAAAPVSRLVRTISGFATAPPASTQATVLTLTPDELDE